MVFLVVMIFSNGHGILNGQGIFSGHDILSVDSIYSGHIKLCFHGNFSGHGHGFESRN